MEQKLLLIKYNTYNWGVSGVIYIRTKHGLVMFAEFQLRADDWEDVRKEINADYEDLDNRE